MPRRLIARATLALALTALVARSTPCSAAPCSESDRTVIESVVQRAVLALRDGDTSGYVDLLEEMNSQLSSPCRAALATTTPASTRCTAPEKKFFLSQYGAAVRAAASGNLFATLEAFESLQESLSPACWTAVNYPQDPGVQRACSTEELDLLTSTSKAMVGAFRQFLTTYDYSDLLQLTLGTLAELSPQCGAALARAQPPGGANQNRPSMSLPSVLDHGGGTYSAPGIGACTPSGCMAF